MCCALVCYAVIVDSKRLVGNLVVSGVAGLLSSPGPPALPCMAVWCFTGHLATPVTLQLPHALTQPPQHHTSAAPRPPPRLATATHICRQHPQLSGARPCDAVDLCVGRCLKPKSCQQLQLLVAACPNGKELPTLLQVCAVVQGKSTTVRCRYRCVDDGTGRASSLTSLTSIAPYGRKASSVTYAVWSSPNQAR